MGCVLTLSAQGPLPKIAVGKPEILVSKNGTYKKAALDNELKPGGKWGTKKTVNEFWIVWSDRDRNPIYADAAKSKKLNRTLAFGEPVVIAEVKGDMALVYDDIKLEHFPDIPSYAKYIGWVPMENLLLWGSCPTNQRGVRSKAIVGLIPPKLRDNHELKKLYKSPEDNMSPQDLTMDMEFYFIMKESRNGKRVLLCRNPTVYGNNLYGWVDNDVLLRWNNRLCMEPNWDMQYVESHKGQEVGVYADPNFTSGNKVTSWEFGTSNNDKNAWYKYRMDPQQLRFPLLDVDYRRNYAKCIGMCVPNGNASYGKLLRDVMEINIEESYKSQGLTEINPAYMKRYLGKEAFEHWKQIKAITAFEGYVPLKDIHGDDYWHYILSLPGDELQQLLYDLNGAYSAAKSQSYDRKPYLDAMRALVKAHLGQAYDSAIDNMDETLLQETIYGFDIEIPKTLINRRKLKDIADSQLVPDIEFRKICNSFCNKYEMLKKLYEDGYTYRTKLGKDWYYWIPIEDLP